MRKLTLYIPGLLAPAMPVHPEDLPALPALDWLLSRARFQPQDMQPVSSCLCELFEFPKKSKADYPIAAITRLCDDNQPVSGKWLRADPVHASPDRDGLILFDRERFKLSQHDALALAADIRDLITPLGMTLEVPVPYRWYLKVPADLDLMTTPLDAVVARDMLPNMPAGPNSQQLVRLMNEVQMTLHNAEVNLQRQQQKQLPVNSVWFWGLGELPDMIERRWSQVIGDDVVARGLAMLAATPLQSLPDNLDAIEFRQTDFDTLLVMDAFQRYSHYPDLEGWFDTLLHYEQNWFAPLLDAIRTNRIEQLAINTGQGIFEINRQSRFWFWKKQKTLASFKHD